MQRDTASQLARFEARIAAGRLRRGLTRAQVRQVCGEPEAVGVTSRRYPAPSCFRYGDVQVFFGPRSRDGLTMVIWEDENGESGLSLPLP